MKRCTYLIGAALVALMILAPSALAQNAIPGDDDPYSPEPNAVVVEHEELERIAGRSLPKTGGPEFGGALPVVLTSSVLLVGLGVLAYGVVREQQKGGSA